MAELIFIFMDAGQGDCTLIVYPDNTLTLVDCGTIKNSDVVAPEVKKVLAPYLANNGNVINNFVLTHPDQDHYNMVKTVLAGPGAPVVNQVYYGGDVSLYKNSNESNATYNWLVTHANCTPPPYTFGGQNKDANLSRANVAAYVLAVNASGNSKASTSHGKNTNSIVLEYIYNGVKTFLMGDASEETEDFILGCVQHNNLNNLLPNTKFSILKMGHHGSDTSSSQQWIQAIKPNGLFISSDTRQFGSNGKGMPTNVHLDDVVKWSGVVGQLPKDFCHSYVYWAETGNQKFAASPLTRLAVCTTLYDIQYADAINFEATGGSWYAYVPNSGPDPMLIGWTGPKNPC